MLPESLSSHAALRWIEFTATIERTLEGTAIVAAVICISTWLLRAPVDVERHASCTSRERHAIRLAVIAIVLVGLALRLAFLDSAQQARFYFSQSTVVAAPYMVEHGGAWERIRKLASNTHVIASQDSPILFAVHWLFQRTFGASFELAGYVGAAWGTLAIVLAWVTGRAMISPTFGLALAACVAVSPLQITWSRLGGLPIAAIAHTLVAALVAFVAGKRRSLWASGVAGALAFASLYHYYAARIAIPVAAIAMVTGLVEGRGQRGIRAWLVLPLAASVFLLLTTAVSQQGTFGTFWPRYTGYVGTAGERTTRDILGGAYVNVRNEIDPTLRRYFWESRDAAVRPALFGRGSGPSTARTPGVQYGGLSLLPLALLGGLGLVYCVRHPVRGAPWIAVTVGGLLLPLLSLPTARRYLTFDLGWCALAAFGVIWLWESAPVRTLRPSWRAGVAMAVFILTAAWSGLAIGLLNATLPRSPGTPIPFGESGLRDGWTCLSCVDQGRRWATTIAQNGFVVLFDADRERENPTSPAGLPLYGRISAHAAKRPAAFVEFYSLLQNRNGSDDAPRVWPFYDDARLDALRYLRERIREASPDQVVWEFRHPTAWEQTLADRLEQAGGQRRPLREAPLTHPTLSKRRPQDVPPPFQIWTPIAQVEAAVDAARAFVDPPATWRGCLELRRVESRVIDNDALTSLGTLDATTAANPNTWAIGSYRFGLFGLLRLPTREPLAMAQLPGSSDRVTLRVLDRYTTEATFVDGNPAASRQLRPGSEFGRGCGAFAGNRWWVVDALQGTLESWPPAPFGVPPGRWFGAAAARGDLLALASASQEITFLDANTGGIVARFAARIAPASPHRLGDCSSIAVGESWVATLDPDRNRIGFYSLTGEPTADVELSSVLTVAPLAPTSIAASGRHLGVTYANRLELLQVIDSCSDAQVR